MMDILDNDHLYLCNLYNRTRPLWPNPSHQSGTYLNPRESKCSK